VSGRAAAEEQSRAAAGQPPEEPPGSEPCWGTAIGDLAAGLEDTPLLTLVRRAMVVGQLHVRLRAVFSPKQEHAAVAHRGNEEAAATEQPDARARAALILWVGVVELAQFGLRESKRVA